MPRVAATNRTAQRVGASTEQRVDAAFAALGHSACLTQHHPETKWIKNAWIRTGAGDCDRSGWVMGSDGESRPIMCDIKHVTQTQRLYRHDPKAQHQLARMLEFSSGGLAGILIVHDKPGEDGGRWLWSRIATREDVEQALAGFALRYSGRAGVELQPPMNLVVMDVPWFGVPDPDRFRAFLAEAM